MIVDHICVNYGAELFQELFMAIQARGPEQNVFYPRNRKHRIADPDKPFRIDSPQVLSLPTKISLRKKQKILQKKYDPLFHRNRPDILHAHTLFSDGSLAYYYHKKYHTPFVVAIRSSDLDVFLKFKPWLKPYGKKILENAQHIVFIAPSLKNKFHQIFGDQYESKSLVIPNGLNESYLEYAPGKAKEPHTPLELLYVGSFLKRKNVPALIKLVQRSKAKLTIVGGGGSEEKRILRMIRNSDRISYLGRIDDPGKLIEIYRQSDIFIMASSRETFGLVYIEAMSQGLPVIFSKNTGIDGLFEPGTIGYGVNPGSLQEMREGIDRIAANYSTLSKNAKSEANQFSWKHLADRYHQIYKRVLA